MQINSRIPQPAGMTPEDACGWFAAMRDAGLLFHPEDDPADIVRIESGEPLFTDTEVEELRAILERFLAVLGEGVCEAGYPVFMGVLRLDPFRGGEMDSSSSGPWPNVDFQ